MNKFGISWLIVLAANALLFFLLTWVNQWLAIASVALYLPAAFVLFTSLHGSNRIAFATAVAVGLFIDALSPLPYLSQTFVLLLCTTVLMSLRQRIRRSVLMQATAIGLVANTLAFLALSLLFLIFSPATLDLALFLRIVTDLLLSQLAFLAVAPWFLEFQKSLLHLSGVNPDAEEQQKS